MNHTHVTTTTTTTAQRPCRAYSCSSHVLASTHSVYCPGHRRAQSRHGHVNQVPITLHHLAPHLDAVKGWRKRNPESPAWAILADRWTKLADHARGLLAVKESGRSGLGIEWDAATLLLQVVDTVEPQAVISMALALYLMRDAEPSRFADERSFRFVLCRRVRKLGPLGVASYWSQAAQRMTKVYRDPPPRVTTVLGNWLAESFGPAGLQLAGLERQRGQQEAQKGQRLADALGAMQ